MGLSVVLVVIRICFVWLRLDTENDTENGTQKLKQ